MGQGCNYINDHALSAKGKSLLLNGSPVLLLTDICEEALLGVRFNAIRSVMLTYDDGVTLLNEPLKDGRGIKTLMFPKSVNIRHSGPLTGRLSGSMQIQPC
jgi:hypothetical protein